jgi:hypothetical protein
LIEPWAFNHQKPRPDPWLPLGLRHHPRPGHEKVRPKTPRLRGSLVLPVGTVLSTTSSIGSCMGCDATRQTPQRPLGARGLPSPHISPSSRPPSSPGSLQKVHLGEASPSQHSLTLSVSEQSSWMMPRASLAPQHRHGPHNAAARPSYTPTHVDHRLISPKPPCI